MNQYPYNSELSKPMHIGNINFENHRVQSALRFVFSQMSKRLLSYQTPSGIKMTVMKIQARDGHVLNCFQIEPENSLERLSAVLYLHGGAFVVPIQEMMLANAARYAKILNCRVFLPEYRLAPGFSFPTPLFDCIDTFEHLVRQASTLLIKPDKLIVYGDSAGGCLTAALTHWLRETQPSFRLAGQLLIYPVTDCDPAYQSMEDYKNAVWSKTANHHMWNLYLKNGDNGLPHLAVPMQNIRFDGLPPAYVEVAEIDTLRDQGLAYAEKLKAAGVPVQLNVIPGAYHGFDIDQKSRLVGETINHRCHVMQGMMLDDLK